MDTAGDTSTPPIPPMEFICLIGAGEYATNFWGLEDFVEFRSFYLKRLLDGKAIRYDILNLKSSDYAERQHFIYNWL